MVALLTRLFCVQHGASACFSCGTARKFLHNLPAKTRKHNISQVLTFHHDFGPLLDIAADTEAGREPITAIVKPLYALRPAST
jgi:hypothetical protein